MRRAISVRAGVAGEILERRVRHAAVLADVLVRLLALEEDVLPAVVAGAGVAQKRFGVGVFDPAETAVNIGLGGVHNTWRGLPSGQRDSRKRERSEDHGDEKKGMGFHCLVD